MENMHDLFLSAIRVHMRFYATVMEQVETVTGITGAEDILAALEMTPYLA